MILRIRKRGQLQLLQQLNPHLGEIRLPNEVLNTADELLKRKNLGRMGSVAIFIEPVSGFMDEILEKLELDTRQVIIPNGAIMKIETQEDEHSMTKDREWSWYDIVLPNDFGKVYVIYSVKEEE